LGRLLELVYLPTLPAPQIQELIGNIDTSSSFAAFDKMEEKVMQLEAEAESTAIMIGSDSLEGKFKELEGGTVDDELSKCVRRFLPHSLNDPQPLTCPPRPSTFDLNPCPQDEAPDRVLLLVVRAHVGVAVAVPGAAQGEGRD